MALGIKVLANILKVFVNTLKVYSKKIIIKFLYGNNIKV